MSHLCIWFEMVMVPKLIENGTSYPDRSWRFPGLRAWNQTMAAVIHTPPTQIPLSELNGNLVATTWRIIPVSKQLVTSIYKPFRPFVRGTTPFRGLTITMVINHLQVLGWSSKYLQVYPRHPVIHPEVRCFRYIFLGSSHTEAQEVGGPGCLRIGQVTNKVLLGSQGCPQWQHSEMNDVTQ